MQRGRRFRPDAYDERQVTSTRLTDARRWLSGPSGRAAAFFAGMGRSPQAVSLLMAALQKISGTLKRLADAQASA